MRIFLKALWLWLTLSKEERINYINSLRREQWLAYAATLPKVPDATIGKTLVWTNSPGEHDIPFGEGEAQQ